MRKLTALAAAGIAAAALISSAPPASATELYCFYYPVLGLYVGSTTSGHLVPMNSTCRVQFTRINFESQDGTGYYEYQSADGPGSGLCLKLDPGISDPGDTHPVVDYPCAGSASQTKQEEEWSDPPYPWNATGNGNNNYLGTKPAATLPQGLYTYPLEADISNWQLLVFT
jgi:hypothetical protein